MLDVVRNEAPRPPETMLAMMEQLLANIQSGQRQMSETMAEIPLSHYRDPAFFEREQATLFRDYPLVLAHESELPEPGSYLQHDAVGVPIVLTRDLDGQVHAFLNACRHRGTRLVNRDGPCKGKTLVCPYHGWTYELDGGLRHVPLQEEAFPGLNCSRHGLVELPSAVRAGLVWVVPNPAIELDIDAWLGPVKAELEYLTPAGFTLFQRFETTRKANWKLVIDAFLEAYHVRVLHRDTVYPFFLDACAVSEIYGKHFSSLVGRRRIEEARSLPREQWDLREFGSYTHFVFPNHIFVHHPDYSSVLSLFPTAIDELQWTHLMVIPGDEHTEERRPHWEKTLDLIEQGVFQREDLFVAESSQATLASGANDSLLLGRLEYLIKGFHDNVEAVVKD